MLDRPCPIQCTTAGNPLHSPFLPSLLHPCVSVCHHIQFLPYHRYFVFRGSKNSCSSLFSKTVCLKRERERDGREGERERTIGIKVVFCILICEYVIRINEAWQQSKPNVLVCYHSSSSTPPPPPTRLILVLHRLVSLFLFFCSLLFVSQFCSFLGAFAKLRKATINVVMSFCLSVCLSIRMEQLSSHWADFHEI